MIVSRDIDFNVVIVGVGPRGAYAFERLVSVLRAEGTIARVHIHLVEPNELGAGLVYRTAQPEYLLMNTVSCQVTAYLDSTVVDAGPANPGPSLFEWLRMNSDNLSMDDYPRRSDHGRYLAEFVSRCMADLPSNVLVTAYSTIVTDIVSQKNDYVVRLDDGTSVPADFILICAGNVVNDPPKPIVEPDANVRYISNPYPVEKKIEQLDRDSNVGIVGLGLTSIDVILAATQGRGGRFEATSSGFRYVCSGEEPKLIAWSRSGLPLFARGKNQKGVDMQREARILTCDRIDKLRGRVGKIDFEADLLPLIIQEMEIAYYEALVGEDFGSSVESRFKKNELIDDLLAPVASEDRFNWDRLVDPHAISKTVFDNESAYRVTLLQIIDDDTCAALRGNISGPVKAACDVLRDIRDNIRYAVEFHSLLPKSHKRFDSSFAAINNRLAVGPPLYRNQQLRALCDAGILDIFMGPSPVLRYRDDKRVFIESTRFQKTKRVLLDTIVDSRIRPHESLMVKNLVRRGLVRMAENKMLGGRYTLQTIDITKDGFVVSGDGKINRRITAFGQLTEGTAWYTQVAARPGVNSGVLREAGIWALRTVRAIRGCVEVAGVAQSTSTQPTNN